MDKKTLQYSILEKHYQPEKWLEVLKEYFGVKTLHRQPQQVLLPSNDIADLGIELGSFYTSDERLVGLYEIQLKPNVVIERNRVGLRSLLRNVYKYDVDAALIVFVQKEKWRFSYVSEIRTEDGKKSTEPKRYTYLFGEEESCRTAADRFEKLKEKQICLNDLFEAFSIEKLNKEFFKKYKDFYERFWRYLADDEKYYELLSDSGQEDKEKKEKPLRDFSKILLGRIVFLHFLQKKGWLGVPADKKDWTGGSKKYLQTLFGNCAKKDKFHSSELRTLFFETLNTSRVNDIAPASLGKNIKIPYLNGGLFDRDISFENKIDFPAEMFSQLLEFFEQYNFTIDENDPYDGEVGIDPEMLGHIFENLLEENRDRGAFYTPKEIVHYMCHESLIQYLRTHLPECTEDESPATKALENFIRNGVIGDRHDRKNFIVQQAKRIEKLLDNVKICDPAIGSGAFPMGLLQEIFRAKTSLDLTLDPAEVKRQIIQNNIYGVDIEPGAVDIARLRFWLSLVVDETEPQPLPNLDYKIMQGNSLLEQFEDISLKFERAAFEITVVKQVDLFGKVVNPQYTINEYLQTKQHTKEFDITDLEEKYFNTSNIEEKKRIRGNIESFEKQFIIEQLDERERKLEELLQHKEKEFEKDLSAVGEAKAGYLRNGKKSKEIEKQKAELSKIAKYRLRLNEIKPDEKPWFLWHLYFMEVFKDGGFDIVIGNPPYIQMQKNGGELARLYWNKGFETFDKTGDIYALFFERGTVLLKSKGLICYITSNQWLQTNYGKILKEFFINNANPKLLINFGGLKVFENATVDTSIFIAIKENCDFLLKASHFKNDFKIIQGISEYFEKNVIYLKDLDPEKWLIASDSIIKLKSKIRSSGSLLKFWDAEILRGIVTGFNEAFIVDQITKNALINEDPRNEEIIKPILRGRDVHKFALNYSDLYIIHTHNGIKDDDYHKRKSIDKWLIKPINVKDDYPSIYRYLQKFERSLTKRQDQGDDWTNLRNCTYFEKFEQPKIIYPETTVRRSEFFLDTEGYFIDKTCFMITGDKLHFLTAVLASKCIEWYLETELRLLGKNSIQYSKQYIENVPIPGIEDDSIYVNLIEIIQDRKKDKIDSSKWENKIDALVFHLYKFTETEMIQVLDTFKDLSIKDRNQIQNEYWNIANNKFQTEV